MSLKHLFREYLGEDDSLEGVELTSQPRSSEPVVVVSAPPTVVVAPVQTQLVDVPTDETPVKVGLVQPWFCKSFFVFSVCSFGRHLAHESLWYRSAVCRPSFSLRFWSFFFFFSFPFPLGPSSDSVPPIVRLSASRIVAQPRPGVLGRAGIVLGRHFRMPIGSAFLYSLHR